MQTQPPLFHLPSSVADPLSDSPSRPQQLRTAAILLPVPLLLTLWVYFGRHDATRAFLPNDATRAFCEYLAAFLLLFCLPALLCRLTLRRPLSDFGLRPGNWRMGLGFLALGAPLMLLAAALAAKDPAMQAEYPLAKSALQDLPLFIALEGAYLLYYFSWEFFFRGFLLFGLEKPFGPLAAVLIQTIPSTIVHIGKPLSECLAAILAGLLFGWLSLRTRSILYPLALHALVGVALDVAISGQLSAFSFQ
jgi:uncharacterized protein